MAGPCREPISKTTPHLLLEGVARVLPSPSLTRDAARATLAARATTAPNTRCADARSLACHPLCPRLTPFACEWATFAGLLARAADSSQPPIEQACFGLSRLAPPSFFVFRRQRACALAPTTYIHALSPANRRCIPATPPHHLVRFLLRAMRRVPSLFPRPSWFCPPHAPLFAGAVHSGSGNARRRQHPKIPLRPLLPRALRIARGEAGRPRPAPKQASLPPFFLESSTTVL